MHFRKAFIATALAVAPVWAGGKSVNVYWGQHGTDTLESACESDGFEYITLGFINSSPENGNGTGYPGDNFAGHCWAETYSNNGRQSKLYTTCKSIQTGISKCQDNGKKVLLSIGGEYTADSNYTVSNAAKGREFAYFMWNAFGPYNSSWTGPRPFDDPDSGTKNVVDGYDFDIEYPFADETGYVAMINQLRSYISDARRTDLITGAPQCPLQNANVDMEYMLNHAQFDLLFIQFYNNEQCNALKSDGTVNPNFNYAQWESYLKTTPNNATKLFIGLPGSSAAATSGYINLASAKTLLCTYKDYPQFGGAMIWDQYYGLENSNILTGKAYYESIHDILNGGCDGSATTTTASTTTSASSSAACATTPANVQSGITANCVQFYEVQAGQTCQIVADKFGITLAEFYIWNPAVGTGCSNLWADEYYCVAVGINSCPATTTTATSAFSSTSSSVISTSSAYSTSSIYSASSSSYSASSSSYSSSSSIYSSSSSAAQTTSLSSSESISQSASLSSASSVQSYDPTTTPSVSQTSASSTGTSDIISSTASASQTSASSTETYDPTGTSTSDFASSTASATQTSVSSTETDDCDEPTGTSTSDFISSTASVTQTSASSTETDDCDEPTDTSSSSVVVSTSVSVSASSTETAVSSTEAVSSSSSFSSSETQVTSSSSAVSSATEGVTSSGSAYPTSSTEVSASSSSIPVSSTPYPNGTITSASQVPTSSSEIWTTSTLYTTTVYTITSCAPTVTNCPAKGHVTTEVIAYTTTVCPVTENQAAPTTTSAPAPVSYFTSTVYTTTVYTITSCPAAVPNCPAKGSATTEVIPVSTTVIPIVEVSVTVVPIKEESTTTTTQKTFIYSTITVPKPIATGIVVNPGTNVTLPSGSGYSYSIPSPSATTASSGCTGPSCPASTTTSVVTAGAGRNVAALAVPALLAALALAL